VLEAESLILILDALFRTSFRGFLWGRGVSAALRLLAQVLEDLALWPTNNSSADLALRVQDKIESKLVLKLGMVEKKLSST
jgi:hypothetical protein